MTKSPSATEKAGAMTGKRHSKVTKMIRDIPHHSNKGAQASRVKKPIDERNLTGRSGWWKDTMKNTPAPGTYHTRDFIEEASLNPVRMTYGFRITGRNIQNVCIQSGAMLLPGTYSFSDWSQDPLLHGASYSFKNCPRPDNYTLGIRNKDVDLSPCHYNMTEKPVSKLPCKHAMLRSTMQRSVFLPKEGPAPGHYNLTPSSAHAITSCFKSTVPHLYSIHSKTPGPGTYELLRQISPYLGPSDNMNNIDGLLYRNVL